MSDNCKKTEHIGKGVGVTVNENHTFGTDAVLLADFAQVKKKDKACDFGTGCAIIPLIWKRDCLTENKISAVEIQEEACLLAEQSLKENGFEKDIYIFNFDLREIRKHMNHSIFDVVTMNPPYFSEGTGKESPNESVRIARHEVKCDIFSAAESASYVLKYSGRFCVCHRSERLCDVFEAMRKNSIEPKRLREVISKAGGTPYLVLVEGRKGGKGGLKIEPTLVLYDENNEPTDEMKKIYSGFFEGN